MELLIDTLPLKEFKKIIFSNYNLKLNFSVQETKNSIASKIIGLDNDLKKRANEKQNLIELDENLDLDFFEFTFAKKTDESADKEEKSEELVPKRRKTDPANANDNAPIAAAR